MIFYGILLAIVSIIHLVYVENKKIIFITKPFLMPLIILYYISSNTSIEWLIILGLIFGLFGDIFLMLPAEKKQFFMLGLVSFLIGHIFYIVAFIQNTANIKSFNFAYLLLIIPYLILAVFIISVLKDDLGKLFLPTVIYMAVILTMSFFAFIRALLNGNAASWITFIGSLLFVSSDSILAWDKFHKKIRHGRFYVMLTYILGQFLIAQGFII